MLSEEAARGRVCSYMLMLKLNVSSSLTIWA